MSMNKVLVLAGSARTGSFNKRLAAVAANELTKAGADVSLIDLNDFEAPVYHGDLEASSGLPETMKALKALITEHDAMFIVTPEYNGSVPPLLVNAFSWVSRPEGAEKVSLAFVGKTAAIAAASPGGLGGVRVIPRLRDYLSELGVQTIPGFATLPAAHDAFDTDGGLKNEMTAAAIQDLATRLIASH